MRIGVALLVTGLVLLGNFAYENWIVEMPAWSRLLGLFSISGALSGLGYFLTKQSRVERFGEVLLGGGMAFFYWCVYASHHFERFQVITSPVVGAALLLLTGGLIMATSLRRDTAATAVIGLLLASYSTVLQPLGVFFAVSNVILAACGLFLLRRKG